MSCSPGDYRCPPVALMRRAFVEPRRLRELYEEIEPELYRFPAINPATFRAAVESASPLPR